jgi:glutamyl-tRNA reductase
MATANWHLYVCGINHKTSSAGEREPLQLSRDGMAAANSSFGSLRGILETAIVSTCNRIEFYFVADRTEDPFESAKLFYQQEKGANIESNRKAFYAKKDRHAADHLMRVAAGIDSMVIGENQILGQLKDAYSLACSVKSAGKVIHRLFHQAFRAGKQARTDTEIGTGICSVSGAAMEIVAKKFGRFNKPAVLFVGVNQMIALSAKSISSMNCGRLIFANRTFEKAAELARKYDAEAYPLDMLDRLLPQVGIVVSCTSAQEPIITRNMINGSFRAVAAKSMLMVDLALPRDIELQNGDINGIEVIDLDYVKNYLKDHRQRNEEAIPQVEEIIQRRVDEFMYWCDHVRNEPLYNGLGEHAEALKRQELAAVLPKLTPELREEVDRAVARIIERLVNTKLRMVPGPTKRDDDG